MIETEFVLKIHEILIEEFGGIQGIRDFNGFISSLSRPYATFDGKDLYPSVFEKAAALIESLISNHPFIDGNKRIGYFMMRFFLLDYNYDIQATQQEKFDFVISIASGSISFQQILNWISEKSVSL